ncbi:MAG TPA: hypothetical protein VLF89_06790, partial [Candidatus Saccharimonadales bacterium]|nr:hypothetical protein [Candidatus Saccharimonadales bacterium]
MEKKKHLRIFYYSLALGFKIVTCLILLFPFYLLHSPQVSAADTSVDTSFGIANYLPITDKKVADGDIVSFSPQNGYFLSKAPYDISMVGVVTNNPAISLEVVGGAKSYPVVSTGNAAVNVTTINGDIKKGDPLTTSQIPGKAMKATKTGYIIGAALENYSNSNTHAVKALAITLNVHYYAAKNSASSSIFDVLNLSTIATYEEPIQAFKYFIAAVTVILSFVFGIFSFARTANKGLEVLGRNPLAGRRIELGILLNIIVAIIIVLSGLAV